MLCHQHWSHKRLLALDIVVVLLVVVVLVLLLRLLQLLLLQDPGFELDKTML